MSRLRATRLVVPRRAQRRAAGSPSRRQWSLAARLALSYALSAFLLVAGATWFQYRSLVASLAAEDDQLLRERLADAAADAADPARASGSDRTPRSAAGELAVRRLDAVCRPTAVIRGREPLPAPQCPAAGSASSTVMLRTARGGNGDEWRIATAPLAPGKLREDGWVEVLFDRSRDQEILERFRAETAAVLLGALAAAAALGYGLARRGLRPLDALRSRVERIDARSLDLRLVTPEAPAEVAALTASFDAMLARLQGAFDALSAHSAELAHELRTPLHVLRQQAEVALARARTPAEYREVLGSSLEELDRLRRLADDMLFLARAADPRSVIQREPLDAAAELANVAAYLDALAEEQGVRLETHATAGLAVAADRTLLRRALVNLVMNALRHTPAGGRVTLLAERGERGAAIVVVEDTGVGVPPELAPRAFEPYTRGDGAAPQAGVSGGAGLGLAIVRGIMQLHGGTATLTSAPTRGTRVTLSFPAG